jgi:hypothetical protein
MFDRDYYICKIFKKVQDKNDWPVFIRAETGKNSPNKIIKCMRLLGDSLLFSASVQTISRPALEKINRKNITSEALISIQKKIKRLGCNTNSDLILPLPGETIRSHLAAIKVLMSIGIDHISPYTTMLLTASALYEDEKFKKERMTVKYKVIPRDFGTYEDKHVIETEKVCVSTKNLSFDDYVFLRSVHFIIYSCYNGETLSELFRFLQSYGCQPFELCYAMATRIDSAPQRFRKIFKRFIVDTRKELWNSEKDIFDYYAKSTNFKKLVHLYEGCNLLHRYRGIIFSSHFDIMTEYAFKTALAILSEKSIECEVGVLEAIKSYILGCKNRILDLNSEDIILELPYDISAWKLKGYNRPLESYRRHVKVKFFQTRKQNVLLRHYFNIYGDSVKSRGIILTRLNPAELFKEVEHIY